MNIVSGVMHTDLINIVSGVSNRDVCRVTLSVVCGVISQWYSGEELLVVT